ncbi:hypothetical protein PspR76_06185 [Pseudomonas sp. R76]|nr:hypothetical protein PspR76_06185 [Pseudomonas sp. R76]
MVIGEKNMNIRALEFFVEVVRRNSFIRASEVLHVTQPAISKSIRALEGELGTELLKRTSRGVEATAAGRELYAHSINILNEMKTIKFKFNTLAHHFQGILRLGLPSTTSSSFFVDIINDFKVAHPLVEIKIFESGSCLLERAVADMDIDIAAVMLPVDEDVFDILPFFEDRLNLVVSADHQLSGHEWVSIAELENYNFISFSEDYKIYEYIKGLCAEEGFTPNVTLKSNHVDLIFSVVSSGECVALMPESACHELGQNAVKFIKLHGAIPFYSLALIRRKDKALSKEGAAFMGFAKKLFNIESQAGVDSVLVS